MDIVQPLDEREWEKRWAPHDPPTYQAVLKQLSPSDTILEIGAGDLRFARQMAKMSRRVYAIEINKKLLDRGVRSAALPNNLTPIPGDALRLPFPANLTTGVLLMRHCTHFHTYASRLKDAGCLKLITNARWRLGVETVLLQAPRLPFDQIDLGWYACWCGSTGFVPGPADKITPEIEETVHEVGDCPRCRNFIRSTKL